MIDARFVYMERPDKCGTVRSDFTAKYSQTLDLLEAEIRHLRAKEVTVQAGFRQVRNDGWPYSAAKPEHPAVALQFRTTKGAAGVSRPPLHQVRRQLTGDRKDLGIAAGDRSMGSGGRPAICRVQAARSSESGRKTDTGSGRRMAGLFLGSILRRIARFAGKARPSVP